MLKENSSQRSTIIALTFSLPWNSNSKQFSSSKRMQIHNLHFEAFNRANRIFSQFLMDQEAALRQQMLLLIILYPLTICNKNPRAKLKIIEKRLKAQEFFWWSNTSIWYELKNYENVNISRNERGDGEQSIPTVSLLF